MTTPGSVRDRSARLDAGHPALNGNRDTATRTRTARDLPTVGGDMRNERSDPARLARRESDRRETRLLRPVIRTVEKGQ